jgi:phosphate transport system protein
MNNLQETIQIIDKEIIEVLYRVDRAMTLVADMVSNTKFDVKLYGEVKLIEEEVDEIQVSLDEKVITAIARFQPAAGDLRYLTKMPAIMTDLERITDMLVGIMKSIKKLYNAEESAIKNITYLPEITEKVTYIYRLFKEAFIEKKMDCIYILSGLDDEVDILRSKCIKTAMEKMSEDKELVPAGVTNIIVAQKYERIADTIENLAESLLYISKGEDIRHKS